MFALAPWAPRSSRSQGVPRPTPRPAHHARLGHGIDQDHDENAQHGADPDGQAPREALRRRRHCNTAPRGSGVAATVTSSPAGAAAHPPHRLPATVPQMSPRGKLARKRQNWRLKIKKNGTSFDVCVVTLAPKSTERSSATFPRVGPSASRTAGNTPLPRCPRSVSFAMFFTQGLCAFHVISDSFLNLF